MHQLSPFTCRRLSQLPRLTSVWECDRRPLPTAMTGLREGSSASVSGDCIIWVDSLHGVVRGMNVVPPETGHEAIVRTLLQAIETPQGRVDPARPRKVVVRDREIQFFLRGALQSLDIPVEYSPELPVIDDVFQKLQAPEVPRAKLPEIYETQLLEKSALLWEDAPWRYFSEQEIFAIELNHWDVETLYLSILGLAGMEYGLLFYRELDSLKQFRHKLLHNDDFSDGMQQAFLEQNCLFINFNPAKGVIPMPTAFSSLAAQESATVEYEFGSLHPLEGLRSQLAEEEAACLVVTLEALHRFFKKHDIALENFALKPVTSRFRIPHTATHQAAAKTADKETLSVKISTVPEVSAAFLEETLDEDALINETESRDVSHAAIVDDSVPEGALIMLGSHREKDLEPLREHRRIHYQAFLEKPKERPQSKAKWPVLTIQTTRPKAKQLVEQIKQEGGIQTVCFNPGSDPMSGQVFQIGLIQTAKGHLHLFNEYEISDPTDGQALEKWAVNSTQNSDCCGCIIAAGATGARRGRPTVREVVAFFEAYSKRPEELGLTPLVMSYASDW
ncbi:MAG: hypothetical protein AAFU53_07705 [Cyanobacteria bacterium J06632_3]